MKRHARFGSAVVATCLLVYGDAHAQDGLAVRIELDGGVDPPTCNFDGAVPRRPGQQFRSAGPNLESGNGRWLLPILVSFPESALRRNIRGAQAAPSMTRNSSGIAQIRIDPEPATIEIAPKDTLSTQITFNDLTWSPREWEGLPGPNSGVRFAVAAQFETSLRADASPHRVWTGKIQSIPITARLVAPALKTPHDYLRNGFSRHRDRNDGADPKWISTKDEDSCTPLHEAASMVKRMRSNGFSTTEQMSMRLPTTTLHRFSCGR